MKSIYTNQIEEGISNVILQNRCGSRVTIMTMEDRTDLEFIYKPNAYRRKDFAARNFSNRDNMTHLFDEFYLYEIKHEFVKEVEYDPFLTKLHIRLPNGGTNVISILNVVDENCFVISAVSPLTIAFRPKSGGAEYSGLGGVEEREGVVKQFCSERGEDFVTFVSYSNYLKSRYRVLDDGTYVLQLCEDDFIVVGAEENDRHVEKAIKLQQKTFAQLDEENERKISLFTDVSRITLSEKYKEIEDVVNINRRIVYSMVDEGGVSFGAIQRIYFLVWFRDLMMSTSMFAETGNPSLIRKAFPFCYENPSVNKVDDMGNEIREYLQLVGSHWCKSEDDGLFYITYGLFNLYRSTGDDTYLWEENLKYLISAADIALATLFDEKKGLFGSDTLGETTLANSIFYGYDAVNGSIDQYMTMPDLNEGETRTPAYSYSLYHNVNMYNVFRMMEVLIKASPDVENAVAEKYGKVADELRLSIVKNFKTSANAADEDCHDEYTFHSGLLVMDDGEEVWMNDYRKHDLWEYTWSVSMAMFCPDIELSMASCKFVYNSWPKNGTYGFCPWNTLSRFLKEYGLDDDAYAKMFADEVRDANEDLVKYPMKGGLTEYAGNGTEWKGLPFSTGSFMYSIYALMIQSLPLGLAVRASMIADKLENFYYKSFRINAVADGKGEKVVSWTINGKSIKGSLQIPEGALRTGENNIVIVRGESAADVGVRLYSSNGILSTVISSNDDTAFIYEIYFATTGEMVFENLTDEVQISITDVGGCSVSYEREVIKGTDLVMVRPDATGDLVVKVG